MPDKVLTFPDKISGREPPGDVLLSEDQVLAHRPMLARSLLLAARKALTITWTKGSRGRPFYRLADVDAFLKTRETQCQGHARAPSLNSADIGSPQNPDGQDSIISGMTTELAAHAGESSAARILGKVQSA